MENKFQTYNEFLETFNKRKEINYFNVTQIPFKKLDQWKFDKDLIYLKHTSGKFFKIEGVKVKTNYGYWPEWDQPMINQHEIGILGLITKMFDNNRYYLMQAKMEPGCINTVQLSPTVQATKSNFSQVHKGKLPNYLEYFIDRSRSKIIIDQLQSEQGGRFLRKRNRNMIVEVKEDIPILNDFFWLTLDEIKKLMHIDNFINMDTRSVISTIPLTLLPVEDDKQYFSTNKILSWYIDQKVKYELEIEKIPLRDMKDWVITYDAIVSKNDFFSVIAVKVEALNREVRAWTQPMIKDLNIGLMGFLVKEINGIKHFLVQTKVMPGNIDIIDLSPSISCSNYKRLINTNEQPLFLEYFLNSKNYKIHLDVIQSEEGGRFYHFQNRNMIVEILESEELDIPDNYMWITYNQMAQFIPKGMFNVESRSLIAAINFI
jgi:dTDP-4-dehydro-6-deoxy-alpha-D-glucopyranose 2,3-dehydratase